MPFIDVRLSERKGSITKTKLFVNDGDLLVSAVKGAIANYVKANNVTGDKILSVFTNRKLLYFILLFCLNCVCVCPEMHKRTPDYRFNKAQLAKITQQCRITCTSLV